MKQLICIILQYSHNVFSEYFNFIPQQFMEIYWKQSLYLLLNNTHNKLVWFKWHLDPRVNRWVYKASVCVLLVAGFVEVLVWRRLIGLFKCNAWLFPADDKLTSTTTCVCWGHINLKNLTKDGDLKNIWRTVQQRVSDCAQDVLHKSRVTISKLGKAFRSHPQKAHQIHEDNSTTQTPTFLPAAQHTTALMF